MADSVRAGTRLSVDDLWAMFPDEDGLRHELIDGEHFVTPAPATRHQQLVGRLHYEVEHYLRAHPGIGQVFLAPFDVIFSPHDLVEPDLLLIATDQQDILTRKNVQGAPALVIEVLSPSTRSRDLQNKCRLFDRGGVREYWIVDPDLNWIEVHRRPPNGGLSLAARLQVSAGDSLATPILPGFVLPLSALFADGRR